MQNVQARRVTKTYQDPVELIWISAAAELGMTVIRDPTVFASWDGDGTLKIGTPETLDSDDCLAQMIFHEICHWLVEGADAWHLPDWGLDSENPEHAVRELACVRLQATLADRHGLRDFFAVTTEFRDYFDRLGAAPLADDGDAASELARSVLHKADKRWQMATIDSALRRTARIAAAVSDIAPEDSLWRSGKATG